MKKKTVHVGIDDQSLNVAKWQRLLQGLHTACEKAGMTVNVHTRSTLKKQADSDLSPLILTGTDASFLRETALELENEGQRVVLAGIESDQLGLDISCAAPSRRNETRQLVNYLFTCGRRRIALAGFGTHSVNDRVRLLAAEEAFEAQGLSFSPRDVWKWEEDPAGCLRSFLSRASEYDAVICPNDILAISLINLCKSSDIRVPDDLYVASFGNTAVGRLYSPSITTMTMDMYSVGMQAFSAWQVVRADPTGRAVCHITVPSCILVRESTALNQIERLSSPAQAIPEDPYYQSPTIMPLEIIERCMAHLDKLDLLILAELMDGTSYENVCEKLFLSQSTLRYRLGKIYKRLGVTGRRQMENLVRSQFYGTNPFRRALMLEEK